MDSVEKLISRLALGLMFAGILLAITLPGKGNGMPKGPEGSSSLNAADRQFLTGAAEDTFAQVELAKLAVHKTSSPEVKSYSERMLSEHNKTIGEIRKLAEDKGIELPKVPSQSLQPIKSRLDKMPGGQFDSAYMAEMLKGHKAEIAVFEREQHIAADADIKSLASKTLPRLQAHLKQAENVGPHLTMVKATQSKPSPAVYKTRSGTGKR